MRIGIDIKVLAKQKAGIARNLSMILDQLQHLDAENIYFLFERKPSSYVPTAPNWHKVLVRSFLPGALWLMMRLPRHLRSRCIDVFWAPENILPPFFFPRAMRRILTVCDLTVHHYPQTMHWWNYCISRAFTYTSLRGAHRIIAISIATKQDIARSYPYEHFAEKTEAIYCGKPEWSLPPGYSAENRGEHLLFVGSVEPRKNLKNILRALAELRKNGCRVPLRIAGPSGWKNRAIKKIIVDHGLLDQITICGYVDEERLKEEYLGCKALIFPSLYEGFGLPVLEALQLDTLVITSRDTVMEEIGDGALILVDPFSVEDIAEKIAITYLKEFDRAIYLTQRHVVLKQFSWQKAAREHLRIFSEEYAVHTGS